MVCGEECVVGEVVVEVEMWADVMCVCWHSSGIVPQSLCQVSLDIGDFEEVIKSYHRLLDLKEKFCDSEVSVGSLCSSFLP